MRERNEQERREYINAWLLYPLGVDMAGPVRVVRKLRLWGWRRGE